MILSNDSIIWNERSFPHHPYHIRAFCRKNPHHVKARRKCLHWNSDLRTYAGVFFKKLSLQVMYHHMYDLLIGGDRNTLIGRVWVEA